MTSLEDAVIDRIQNRAELAIAQKDIKIVVQAVRDELNLPFGTPLIRIGAELKQDWDKRGDKIVLKAELDHDDKNLLALSHMSGGIVVFGVDESAQPTEIERVADENEQAESEDGQGEIPDTGDGDDSVTITRPKRLAGRRKRK